jgi:surface antigen
MKKILCLALIALFVSGCMVTDRKNKLAVAAVTGGAAGAYIGWNIFGGGSALLGALAIGGLGAGAGYLAADTLLPRERDSLHRATYQSLEGADDGQAAAWKSTDTDATARITPVRSFVGRDGQPCREFVIQYQLGESRESIRRTAARAVDGSWRTT